MWDPIENDPKLDKFIDDLKNNKLLKNQKYLYLQNQKKLQNI